MIKPSALLGLGAVALALAALLPRKVYAAVPSLGALAGGGSVAPGFGAVPPATWQPPALDWPSSLPSFDDVLGDWVLKWNSGGTAPGDGGALLGGPGGWLPPDPFRTTAAPYIAEAQRVEFERDIPAGLLVRLLWEESKFNPNASNPSGAVGIAQIVPSQHPSVNAFDPVASIRYAGGFLAQLFRQFGDWSLALMAYHAGAGNVAKYVAGKPSGVGPLTIGYAQRILADVAVA